MVASRKSKPSTNGRQSTDATDPKAGTTTQEYEDEFDEEEENEDDANKDPFALLLPKPRPFNRTVIELYDLLSSEYMDLDPEYQRDVVWPDKMKSELISSLLNNFYVPPVIFSITVKENAAGKRRQYRVCIDGKQRLSSIQAYKNSRSFANMSDSWKGKSPTRSQT